MQIFHFYIYPAIFGTCIRFDQTMFVVRLFKDGAY